MLAEMILLLGEDNVLVGVFLTPGLLLSEIA